MIMSGVEVQRAGMILSVADVNVSSDFYVEHFGFSVEQKFDEPPYVILQGVGTRLSLSWHGNTADDLQGYTQSPPVDPHNQATMLVFEVANCDEAAAILTQAGVEMASAVFRPPWGGGRFFALDPDGYLIEVEELA
jgi:predicted enzyme related to lactoylglutathione lyase